MGYEQWEAVQTGHNKIARMQMRVGQRGTELHPVRSEPWNELFGVHAWWQWLSPFHAVEFPRGMRPVVLGYEWDPSRDNHGRVYLPPDEEQDEEDEEQRIRRIDNDTKEDEKSNPSAIRTTASIHKDDDLIDDDDDDENNNNNNDNNDIEMQAIWKSKSRDKDGLSLPPVPSPSVSPSSTGSYKNTRNRKKSTSRSTSLEIVWSFCILVLLPANERLWIVVVVEKEQT